MDTLLEYFYHWENTRPDKIWLTQPMGEGKAKTWTWKEAGEEARLMAGHLKSMDLPDKSHIGICSKNCAWWILADLAIWMAGHVSVPVHAVLTQETVRHTLDNSQVRLLFVGKLDPIWNEMKKGVPGDLPKIAFPISPEPSFKGWDEITGSAAPLTGRAQRSAREMASIVYTSGSTGKPKGAMISFNAMLQAPKRFADVLGVSREDRVISYMPLSHVYERLAVETISLFAGVSIWFSESLETFVDDVKRARPTFFFSVPRLWVKFQLGVFEKMPPHKLARLLKIPLIGGLVKKKILKGLGLESVKYGISAGAPLSAEILKCYRKLGVEILEVYSMTENFGLSHVTRPGQFKPGYVGTPHEGVEQRLSEQGEILSKSPSNMLGYYNNPQATKEVFTEDGFLRTGDLGIIDESGCLKVTGRTKEEFKTAKGKYILPAHIEDLIIGHPDIEACMVSGSGQAQPYGLVLLSPNARESVNGGKKDQIEKELTTHLNQINTTLPSHEKLAFFTVTPDDWTPENGLMTPTMKLKRGKLEDIYDSSVDDWYHRRTEVVWADRIGAE